MKLSSQNFNDGARIPGQFTFCIPAAEGYTSPGDNHNPQLAWTEVPAGTRSFVLICHDPDVPSVGDDVNQEGRSVSASLPRVDFFHWVLVDLPADLRQIDAGQFSSAISTGGKPGPDSLLGTRQGLNDFTVWFGDDEEMKGDYYGYDGPCPPWNDELVHRYVFTLYALDVERCPLEGNFTGPQVLEIIRPHVLAQDSLIGTYTLNPALL